KLSTTTSPLPLHHLSTTSPPPLHHLSTTSPPPLHHLSTTSPSPLHHLSITSPSPLHHLSITSPSPLHHLSITSPSPLHHLSITSPPPLHHLSTTSPPPLHHLSTTSPPPLHHLSTTSPPPLHHLSTTSPPPLHHLSTTSPPPLHHLSTTTSPPPLHHLSITSPTPLHHLSITSPTSLHHLSITSPSPLHRLSITSPLPLHLFYYQAFMGVASAPWNVTKAGYNMFAGAVKMTGDVMSAFIPPRQKLRRSTRRHVQTKAEDFTFPVSPGKKRKRSNGNSDTDNGKLYELLYVEQPYESGEDPDYCPEATSDTSNDSESSDTVGASDEERDSGEGDEADTSTIGGESLTPEQISKALKSKRGQVVHGQQVTADIKESNESREVHVGDKVNGEEAVGGEEAQATVTTKAEKLKVEKSKFQSDVKTNIKPPAKAKSVTRAAGKDNTPASSHSGKSNSTSTGSPGKSQVDMATNSKRVAERIKEKSPSKKDGKNGMGAASTSKMDDVTKGRIVL
ncbi:hypothetical protein QZH41_008722, partial [Actinostola sp. cb2023]